MVSAAPKWYVLSSGPTNKTVYAVRTNSKPRSLHRLIMQKYSNISGKLIDHINGNGLDNRKENLRVVGRGINTLNTLDKRRDNTSGFRRVNLRPNTGHYRATILIRLEGHDYSWAITFPTALEAAEASDRMALIIFENELLPHNLNFPNRWDEYRVELQ